MLRFDHISSSTILFFEMGISSRIYPFGSISEMYAFCSLFGIIPLGAGG